MIISISRKHKHFWWFTALFACASLLISPSASFANVVLDSLFFQAVVHGDGKQATLLLNQGANIDAQDETGATLLHQAVLYSNLNLVQWVLERGANIDIQVGNNCVTPLMLAAYQQDASMCQYLIERGATITIRDKDGETAADYALNTGYIALANFLRNPKNKLQRPYLAELISQAATAFSNYNYTEAIKINQELCLRLKKEIAPDNILYTKGLNDLGMCYMTMGDYTNAKKYMQKAVNIAQKYSPNSNVYYTRCVYYASAFFNNAEYDEAFNIYLDCLQNIQLITDSQVQWTIYNNMGVIAIHWGKYELAEKMLSNAVALGKQLYGVDNEEYAMYAFALANLGGMYMEQGNSNVQEKAELFLSEALEIYQNHNDYGREFAGAYKNYGALMANMGDYELALQIYLAFANIVASVFGEKHNEYAYALDAIAGIYICQENYDEALQLLTEAKHIREANRSMQTPQGASLLINLGDLYERIEIEHPETKTSAEEYFKEAIDIITRTIGENTLKCAGAINYLSAYYYRNERYQEALDLEEKSMNIIENIIGKQNQNYLTFYANKCATYQAQHRWKEALSSWDDFTIEFKQYVKDMFPILSEEERTLFWNSFFEWRYESMIPSLAYRSQNSTIDVNGFAYDNILFTKGILLSSSEQIRLAILNSGDNDLINSLKELNSSKEKLLLMLEQSKSNNSQKIDSLQQRIRFLDKYLSQHSKVYKDGNDTWNYNWKMVQSTLPDDAVAMEFVRFHLWDHYETDSLLYAVLLIDKSCDTPIYVSLFEEKQALSLIHTATESQTNCTYEYKIEEGDTIGNGAQLANIVWGKIMPYIHEGETIYFAPSGLLHQLAIEALPYDETRTMADVFNLVRLSSTREIVLRKDELQHTTATLYGGIQYNMSGDELLAESEQYATSDLLASRGIENDTLNRGTVDYLKGTKEEVENINKMLKDNKLSVQLFTTTNANEESFKALSGKHQNILHIATHGFYWSDSTAQKKDYFSQRMLMMDNHQPTPPSIDPLNRCGLLFAGANTALSGHSADLPEGVQDGILTAKEISLLDLRDADLVVLSACETGKGEITGEGVFGLQRAFKQAGAQTIIMSLWSVNDVATQLLMTEFYRNWITLHQSKREAFRNAQNTVRSQYPEPAYWAGFIMLD